ncbi:MAG: hypothetical protein NXI31_09560 [bacterium]|nr:hypothetical protein [bacterium]
MFEPRRAAFVVLVGWVLGLATLRGQDPARDLPWRRPGEELTAAQCFETGTAWLRAGWSWEAARYFRELTHRDADQPMGHLGLALAFRAVPNRAARLMWEASKRAANGSAAERAVLGAYQRYFGVTRQPELVDPAFRSPPAVARAQQLITDLQLLDGSTAEQLLANERARLAAPPRRGDPGLDALRLRQLHGYLATWRAMPFVAPGYAQVYADATQRDAGARPQRIPRHPDLRHDRAIPAGPMQLLVPATDAANGRAVLEWQPPLAPGFDLPRGLGGRGKFAGYAGKPVLVVFFLGFG